MNNFVWFIKILVCQTYRTKTKLLKSGKNALGICLQVSWEQE